MNNVNHFHTIIANSHGTLFKPEPIKMRFKKYCTINKARFARFIFSTFLKSYFDEFRFSP